jgi:hypothetical protein
MKGFLFRLSESMKNFGERHWWSAWIKPIGLKLKDWVLTHSTIGEMR